MNKNHAFIITIFLVLSLVAAEKLGKESFIAQPKPKKESRSSLQEDIATLLMHTTQQNPHIIEREARVEQRLLRYGSQLLAQDKNSFFATAGIKELQEFRALLQELSSAQETYSQFLVQLDTKFNKLMCSSAKN